MGAAILGGVGAGIYGDWTQAANRLAEFDDVEIDADMMATYDTVRQIYSSAYPALRSVFQALAQQSFGRGYE